MTSTVAAAGAGASHGVSAGPVVAIVAIVAAVVIIFVLVVSYVLHQRALNAKDPAATAAGPARVQALGANPPAAADYGRDEFSR